MTTTLFSNALVLTILERFLSIEELDIQIRKKSVDRRFSIVNIINFDYKRSCVFIVCFYFEILSLTVRCNFHRPIYRWHRLPDIEVWAVFPEQEFYYRPYSTQNVLTRFGN